MEGKIRVYKLVREDQKSGRCYPLFIEREREFVMGEWFDAHFAPRKGFAPRSINGVNSDEPIGGLHCCFYPFAPHLSMELKSGEKRVWIECEARGESKTYKRPWNQGGAWILVESIKPLRKLTQEDVDCILAANKKYLEGDEQ